MGFSISQVRILLHLVSDELDQGVTGKYSIELEKILAILRGVK